MSFVLVESKRWLIDGMVGQRQCFLLHDEGTSAIVVNCDLLIFLPLQAQFVLRQAKRPMGPVPETPSRELS